MNAIVFQKGAGKRYGNLFDYARESGAVCGFLVGHLADVVGDDRRQVSRIDDL